VRRRSGALEWGFAAALLVASIGVSAWWMRAPDPAGAGSAAAPAEPIAAPVPASTAAAPAPATAAAAAEPAAGAGGTPASSAPTAPAAAVAAPPAAAMPSPPVESAPAPAEEPARAAVVLAEAPPPAPPAPRSTAEPVAAPVAASAAEARREVREPVAERPRALASAAPPERPAAYRGPPRVLVLAIGDPAVAAVVEAEIESRLDESRLVPVDEDLLPGLATAEDRNPDLPGLLAAARRHAEIVILARVVPLGQQELTFYGQSSTQYSARIDIAAYDTAASRKLGAGWNADVSFTHLNARQNTVEAIAPLLGRIDDALARRGRG
jgi:hypothetical protein